MEIKPLDRETYAGKTFTARYRTNGYYEIRPSETGFQMDYVPFAEPTERSFDDVFFGEWLEDPIAFGAFEGKKLIGYVEGSIEGLEQPFSAQQHLRAGLFRAQQGRRHGADEDHRASGGEYRGAHADFRDAVVQ